MKTLNQRLLVLILSIGIYQTSSAEIRLPAIISSNMVMQRNAEVQLWGWAEAGEEIEITASWISAPEHVVADQKGTWRLSITTTLSKSAQQIRIKSAQSNLRLENVLFGEVWLCSGQSNMQQPLKGFKGQPTFGSTSAIVEANNPNLRLFSVARIGASAALTDLEKYDAWQSATPASVADFSAVGYFYGQQLQALLDVPVGLIHSSWGGSLVEAWISRETLETYQTVDLSGLDPVNNGNRVPTALFNGMLQPLIPFTIKGVLWYQGESNRKQPAAYKKLFPAMVADWRERWNIGAFPVYFVQIAPFKYGDNEVFQANDNTAFMREAQVQCVDLIPNSAIAITLDIGDSISIHPPKKKEVADRLLYHALNRTYGQKIPANSPQYDTLEVKGQEVLLKFKYAANGLYALGNLDGFELAGKDKVFYPAKAKIMKQTGEVSVTSTAVPDPVAVRYAWRNWTIATLYGSNMLPVSSFRTDNWEEASRAK